MEKTESDAAGDSTNGNGNGFHPKENGTRKASIEVRVPAALSYPILADARNLPLASESVDLIVTSPPYWKKRDYGVEQQIGLEGSPEQFIEQMMVALKDWRRVLRKTGSIFLNIGDTYHKKSLAGIPGRLEAAAMSDGWVMRNRIMWAKDGGMPDPAKDRLANRYEFIYHFVRNGYYYDLLAYAEKYGNGANPGDIWRIEPDPNDTRHLAPFPEEIVERAIMLACPLEVCSKCRRPRRRVVERTAQLDERRPQARRAMELAKAAGLTPEHIAAVQASGISDAGKAQKIQNGTGKNAQRVKDLAGEAKKVLGGYFREFTFAKRVTTGWTRCECRKAMMPGVVLDPFMGSGTTLRVANRLGRTAVGTDLTLYK